MFGDDLISKVLFENEEKGIQYRLTITEFRDVRYIGIREFYRTFEGDYASSKNGVTIPYTLHTTASLFSALARVVSLAEVDSDIREYIRNSEEESNKAKLFHEINSIIPLEKYELEYNESDGSVTIRPVK